MMNNYKIIQKSIGIKELISLIIVIWVLSIVSLSSVTSPNNCAMICYKKVGFQCQDKINISERSGLPLQKMYIKII